MKSMLGALLLALLLRSSPACAQPQETGERVRIERPPEGSLRRGWLPVPAWAAYAGGAAIFGAATIALVLRLGRRRR